MHGEIAVSIASALSRMAPDLNAIATSIEQISDLSERKAMRRARSTVVGEKIKLSTADIYANVPVELRG